MTACSLAEYNACNLRECDFGCERSVSREYMPPNPTINDTLTERGNRYGEFKDQAVYAQGMADIARASPNWAVMAPDQREGLSIIFNKIGRILNGDPDYSDSWHDIAGYATLVDKRLKAEGK